MRADRKGKVAAQVRGGGSLGRKGQRRPARRDCGVLHVHKKPAEVSVGK